MPVYTVHLPTRGARETSGFENEPASRPSAEAVLVNAQFVPERFSRAAFFLGPIWLAWHWLWLELLLWLLVFSLLTTQQFVAAGASFWIGVLLEVLLGLEANNLRRWKLTRSGYRFVDVAAGAVRDDAELNFYRRYLESGAPSPPSLRESAPPAPPTPHPEVIGLFPLPEDPR
jgi:hypothetical protein